MTRTKQILILPVLAVLISMVAFSAQDAAALVTTINSEISCKAPAVGGTWNSVTSTCTVATLVIGPTDKLIIGSGVNFDIGTVTSSGVIVNDGTIHIASGGVITTSGEFTNNGIVDSAKGTITNSGPFSNFGAITSSGTITNGPTGVIQNNGHLISTGVITTSGAIKVGPDGVLISSGTFTNSLNLVNSGTIMTSGTFTNSGPVMNFDTILNEGLFSNSNTITNWGNIHNLCNGSITNSGTIAIHKVIELCIV
ncbi:transporter [Nitrosopumilus sp. S4]